MKIVFINTGSIDQNAGIIRCLCLGEQLVRLNHDVTILINNHPLNIKAYGSSFKGIKFIYSKTGSIKEQLDKLNQLNRLGEVDYIHCMGVGSSIFFPALIYKICYSKNTKLIVDFEDRQVLLTSPERKKLMLFFEKLGTRKADKVICASQALADLLESLYNREIAYLPFAITGRLDLPDKALNSQSVTIGYMGNLIQAYKDQIVKLLDVVKLAAESNRQVKLLIAGKGDYETELKETVKAYNIEKNIELLGFIPEDELDHFFSRVQVLVFYLPQTDLNKYRCPNKAYIYASTGLPIVSSQFGEIENILRHYSRNVFFDNSSSSAENLLECIDKALRVKEPVSATFYTENSWEVRAKQYLKILQADENIN